MSFCENLRNELTYQDIRLKELSGMIDIPYTTLLSYVNNKKCIPKVDIGLKIAQALNVSVEYLVTGNERIKYKKEIYSVVSELFSLPINIQKPILKVIHNFYEQQNDFRSTQ